METRLYKMVEASLLNFPTPFSVDDVFKAVEVKRHAWGLNTNYESVAAYLSKLSCEGKLERLAPGIYVKIAEDQEVAPAKYKVIFLKIVAPADCTHSNYSVSGKEPFSVACIEERPAVENEDYTESVMIEVLNS